jgi:cytochrome c-type biogenesis protein CcmH/NrfG
MALHKLGKFEEAIQNYELGIKLNPSNPQLKQGLEQCK